MPCGDQARDPRARTERHAGLLEARPISPRRPSTRKASTGPATPCALPTRRIRCQGLMFDGRLAEDFKLTTGTWVRWAALRVGALAAASPALADAVIAGEDRDFVGLLAWLNRRRLPAPDRRRRARTLAELAAHPASATRPRGTSRNGTAPHTGSSAAHRRVLLLARPALDRRQRDHRQGLHQPARRARMRRREVERLYAAEAGRRCDRDRVIHQSRQAIPSASPAPAAYILVNSVIYAKDCNAPARRLVPGDRPSEACRRPDHGKGTVLARSLLRLDG